MKIFNKIYVVLFAFSIIVSCDDFLEEDPKSEISEFKTEKELELGAIGLYEVLNDNFMYGFNLGILGELGTDTFTTESANLDFEALDRYEISDTYGELLETWRSSYRGIARANFYIDQLEGVNFSETVKNAFVAEARGLRALYYFHLVRMFGEIPLETEPAKNLSKIYTRAPVEDIYTQIVADLQFAKSNLPITAESAGRITSGAAHGLLVKVYLTMAGQPLNKGVEYYNLALQEANEFIALADGGTYPYGLLDQYEEVFRETKENNKEIIFDAQTIAGELEGNRWGKWGGYAGNNAGVVNAIDNAGFKQPKVMPSFYESYANEDIIRQRRNATDSSYKTNGTFKTSKKVETFTIAKFRLEPDSFDINGEFVGFQAPLNIPILRFDDVLLMAAEAENEVNGPANAYANLNRVRSRVNLTAFDGSNFSSLYPDWQAEDAGINLTDPQDAFREAIFWERAWELCYEGHRRFDLVRWGRLVSTVKNVVRPDFVTKNNGFSDNLKVVSPENIQDFHVLFPIPAIEMNISNNNFGQNNPGY
ncbi:RagB/SusD family nutrient uptake outer membrane protein [uncultured Algibacter sp.]|uniref:RagB/SusD family nutrient uptake outer membrane protein n=1 Tax=uncultured Algibacter sp. TaxID=298659 RepID=UPI00261359DA|nr:RagB/SusD family nutrient uptake outer membrane protein [uncultured Algibacter sp.]